MNISLCLLRQNRSMKGDFCEAVDLCISTFVKTLCSFLNATKRGLKKHSTFLLVMITDTAPIFCCQNPLDAKDPSSYTFTVKKQCLIKIKSNAFAVALGFVFGGLIL